jgi:hypothetical protein
MSGGEVVAENQPELIRGCDANFAPVRVSF